MHRIDADGHVNNQFSEGNAATGQEATRVSAAWCNDVQENVCQAIEAADIALVKGQGGQLTAAIQALAAARGHISGLQLRGYDASRVLVRAGSLEIGGRLYVLPADTLITVPAHESAWGWRYLAVRPPTSGKVLDANCFSTWDPALRPVHWGPGWIITENSRRVIGLYPSHNNAVVTFWTGAGKYMLPTGHLQTLVDTAAPPAESTPMYVGLPTFPERVFGDFWVTIRNPGGPGVALVAGWGHIVADICGGATSRTISQQATIWAENGQATLAVQNWGSSGSPNWLRLILLAMHIPFGMAR